MLGVADALIGPDHAWERKTVQDLVRSLGDGSLWNQVREIKENYKYPALLIEGRMPSEYPKAAYLMLKRIRMTLGSIRYDWNIPVDRTNCISDTAMFLVSIHSRVDREKREYYRPVKKKKQDTLEIISDLLCTLPKVGRKTAEQLMLEYGSVKDITSLKAEDFSRIKGISIPIAQRIHAILNLKRKLK